MLQQRDEYPPGVPCWVDLEVDDPDAIAAFYGGLFGWTFQSRAPESAPFRYLVGQIRDLDVAAIGSPADGPAATSGWRMWVCVTSADETVTVVREHGGTVLSAPADIPGAGRSALCADPAGAVFGVWEPHGTPGARVVNEPNSWNFSDLRTSDPVTATSFYDAVFGWVARSIDVGDSAATMWCRPGYGDWLSERDPEVRERHAQEGIPLGFSDAVAWMEQDGADPAQWGITFSTDDADRLATRCAELGGSVVSPPAEQGPTRVAVLQDPAGSVFAVSHYRG